MISAPRRQLVFCAASVAVSAAALLLAWGLRSVRLDSYRSLDRRVAALLQSGRYKQAARLVRNALRSYRDEADRPPAVYAATALVLAHQNHSAQLDQALACLDAAFDSGFSPAERPDLRALYVQLLYRQRRFDRVVSVLEEFPVEGLLPGEQETLALALCELELWEQAYGVVLRALASGTAEGGVGRRLWRLRGRLARQLQGTDWWEAVRASSGELRWLPLIADAEWKLVLSRGKQANRRLRQLAYAQRAPESVRLAARLRLAAILARSGMVAEAATLMTDVPAGPRAVSVWMEVISRGLEQGVALERLVRWYGRLPQQAVRGRERRQAEQLAAVLFKEAILQDDTAHVPALATAVERVLPAPASARIYGRILVEAREGGRHGAAALRLADCLRRVAGQLSAAEQRAYLLEAARLYAAAGHYDRAVRSLLARFQPEELTPDGLAELTEWLRRAGQLQQLDRLEQIVSTRVDDPQVRVWARLQLALARMAAGQIDRAEQLLRANLHEGPTLPTEHRGVLARTRLALAGLCLMRGACSEAVALLADDSEPSESEEFELCRQFVYGMALYGLFCESPVATVHGTGSRARDLYANRRRELYARMKQVFDRLLNASSDEGDQMLLARAALALARAHYAMGQYREALAVLQRAKGVEALQVEVLLEEANCYWKLGDRDRAEDCLRAIGNLTDASSAARPDAEQMTAWVAVALERHL